MNKKTITLKLDATSKIILLILGAGVWFMALKPLGPSSALAQGAYEYQMRNIDKHLGNISSTLDTVTNRLGDISSSLQGIEIHLKGR